MRGGGQVNHEKFLRNLLPVLGLVFFSPSAPLWGGPDSEAEKLVVEAYRFRMGEGRPVDEVKARELYLQAADRGDPRALAWKAQRIYQGEPPFSRDPDKGRQIFHEIEEPLQKMADKNLPYAAKLLASSWALFEREKKGRQAFRLIESLAQGGDPDAMGTLGWFTEVGIGVQADPQLAFSLYQKAAEGGDVLSCWNVGHAYQQGLGPSPDPEQALAWYLRGAKQNEANCQRMVGIAYFHGEGVARDEAKAFSWFEKSARQGNPESQDWLGWLYEAGRGVPADPKQAFAWFQKSAAAGNPSGQKNLARCYEDGIGVSPDPVQAFLHYQKAAEGGQGWAMGKVAKFLETGQGTAKNPVEAFRWWQRQAEAGEFWGPEQVARCHAEGIGTPKNQEEARRWYGRVRIKLEEESKKNKAWAWDNLGRYFYHGLGVERDYAKALECYRKAAELKSEWAMEQIGWCYEKGLGVPADEKEAFSWYRKAAENGQAWSMGQLALWYETGRGTEKNPSQAYYWYRKNAEAEPANRWAQESLGRCHENALGTKKDDREALRWYRKAADAGSLWAGEQAGRFFEEGLGTEKDPEKAYGYYLPAVREKRPWVQQRMVSLGTTQLYEGEYDFAERCFQAAWDSEFRPGADWLHLLHTRWSEAWGSADPLKGIRIKRKSLEGQPEEGVGAGQLAAEALRFGYVEEAKKMTRDLMESRPIPAGDEEKARWHVLTGYAAMADPSVDPLTLQGKHFPESWLKKAAHPPAVGMATFNFNLVHPQSRLDFSHRGDFVAPLAPRRWASYLVQHACWGMQIWREQQTSGFSTLALTATGGPGQGGVFLWADFPVRNPQIAQEHLAIAETLAPSFAGKMGRAVLAWQAQDAGQAQEVLDPLRQELAEEALAAAEKKKQKNPKAEIRDSSRHGWNRQLEIFSKTGIPPWGNARGQVNFGFGISGGSGLFHGQLVGATWKLVVPFVLWLKPDWMLTVADFILQSGALSPMQLMDLYSRLAEKEETRAKACARLAMMQAQLGEKEAAWTWAERAAQERPADLEILRMAVAIAHWANKPKESALWQNRLREAETRQNLLGQDSPEKEYLRIFEAMREAEELEAREQTSEANLKFQTLLQDLKRLRENHPDWENAVVQYRIRILEKKLAPVEKEK